MKSEQILEGWNWDSLLSRIKRKTLNATWIFHWDEFQTQAKNSVEIKILFMPNDGFWYLEPDIRLISQLFFVHMKFNIKHLIASIEKCHIKFHKGKQVNSSVQVKWLSKKKKKKGGLPGHQTEPKILPTGECWAAWVLLFCLFPCNWLPWPTISPCVNCESVNVTLQAVALTRRINIIIFYFTVYFFKKYSPLCVQELKVTTHIATL